MEVDQVNTSVILIWSMMDLEVYGKMMLRVNLDYKGVCRKLISCKKNSIERNVEVLNC